MGRWGGEGGEGGEGGADGARVVEETICLSEIASRVWPRSLFLAVETAAEELALSAA